VLLELVQVGHHGQRGLLVLFAFGQFQQLGRFGQAVEDGIDAANGLFQQRTFASQVLRVFGVVPDIGAFQLPRYFFKTLLAGVVVKDTP